MTLQRMALAMIASLTLTACFDPYFWFGHGHEPGHGGHGGCKKGKDCEEDCPSATHFETEAGVCVRKALVVSAGDQYTCAILSGGTLKCWGDNNDPWGTLGYGVPGNWGDGPGEMGNALPVVPLGAGLGAIDVYAADDATCALIDGEHMKCWGYNGHALVTGSVSEMGGVPPTAALLRMLPLETIQITSGDGYGTILHADGTLSGVAESGVFSYVISDQPVVQFARNDDVFFDLCAVTDDGDVLWGSSSTITVDLGMGHTGIEAAVGANHACVLLDGGSVKCWGRSDYGQGGQGDMEEREPFFDPGVVSALTPITFGQPAIAIAAGHYHTCVLLMDGSVKCWGRNDQGQLGIGTNENMGDEPGEMEALPSVDLGTGRTAVAIDAGTHSCALLDNGGIKCWGPNAGGQLGQGDTAPRGLSLAELGDALPEIDLGS